MDKTDRVGTHDRRCLLNIKAKRVSKEINNTLSVEICRRHVPVGAPRDTAVIVKALVGALVASGATIPIHIKVHRFSLQRIARYQCCKHPDISTSDVENSKRRNDISEEINGDL